MANESLRAIEKISRLILTAVSILLGIFLILLGNNILQDLGTWNAKPAYESFLDQTRIGAYEAEIKQLQSDQEFITDSRDTNQKGFDTAGETYRQEKESYANWITTRQTLNSTDQDSMVLQKTRELDKLKENIQKWQARIDADQTQIDEKDKKIAAINGEMNVLRDEAGVRHERAVSFYNLKVFGIRLLFILPLLALALFLVIKFRTSKYSPFIWGYVLFVLYAFFFGLVPYLPSFGGYVQYSIGVLLTIVIGYYVIKFLQKYLESKKAEVQLSSKERSEKIQEETALKAFTTQTCPSCEHRYLAGITEKDTLPGFCTHCGLQLFAPCETCGKKNFIHFQYCWSCGRQNKKH